MPAIDFDPRRPSSRDIDTDLRHRGLAHRAQLGRQRLENLLRLNLASPGGRCGARRHHERSPRDPRPRRPPDFKIESGAKSALDPNSKVPIKPYVDDDLPVLELTVPAARTVDPERTLWDKVVILHGARRWLDRRGELRGGGQRVSRHYYDLHRLAAAPVGAAAIADSALGADCIAHARMFFNRPDYDLASATPGSFALAPHDVMIEQLRVDNRAMQGMIFGDPPRFEAVLESISSLEARLNGGRD